MNKDFTHLRVASGYSFKYGAAHVEELVAKAATYEMSALALTDRDTMAGAIRFAQGCEAAGITPILGINISFIQKKHRVTLLAQGGHLSSLYRLVTAINMNSDEKILTLEILDRFQEYSKNVLLLHGPESALAASIAARRSNESLSIYHSTSEYFAEQAIECVSHYAQGDGPYSTTHAAKMLGFARDNDLPAVLTNAARMLGRKDGPIADVLDSARNLRSLSGKIVERSNSEGYLKSSPQMSAVADEIARRAGERNGRSLLKTTDDWAQRARLSIRNDIGIGDIHLPEPHVLGSADHSALREQLRNRCAEGLSARYSGAPSVAAAERLEDELSVIDGLGFHSYFLTVADIAKKARDKNIRVSARGSGAGSLICYLLGISNVEPISQGLLMERFCSPLRHELPDIDIDVESHRRLEIYDDVFKEYADSDWSKPGNQSRCATVAMVETYRARHAIRDAGAALGIAPMEIDMIAKSMPHIRARNISSALAKLPELAHLKMDGAMMKALIHLAGALDGLPRHLSMHPCAIALSDIRLQDFAPIERNASGYPMVQFDKDDVEALGLLKLDILGVRMQSAISYALDEIERIEGTPVDIDQIPLDDKKTFDLIKSTKTLGLFQIESPGQRELVGKFAPSTFTDLIIDISLFRPGPVKSDMITPFINTRHGHRQRLFIHKDLEGILAETEGVVVFHEQVIRLISTLTGCSLAQGDEKRRALGSPEGQQEVVDWFYPTSLARGYSEKVVTEVWDILRAFASFGFCKAHAAAFALPTYQSAWLKTHHTAAFIAGVLQHDPGMYPKRLIIDEARQWGIHIAPIDINLSDGSYHVERTSLPTRAAYVATNTQSSGQVLELPDASGYAIRMSLQDIDGISSNEIETISAGRPYIDIADFIYRSGASYPTTEALISIGAFDQLHGVDKGVLNRRDLLLKLKDMKGFVSKKKPNNAQISFNLLSSDISPSGLPNMRKSEIMEQEISNLGIDISAHVLSEYAQFLNHIGAVRSCDLITKRSDELVLVAGVKVALQTPPVRSGKRVMFLTLDDGYGCNDLTFFEDTQTDYAQILRRSSLILVEGHLRKTGPRGISIRATRAWELDKAHASWHQSAHLRSKVAR